MKYNRKWFRLFMSCQTHSKLSSHHVCTLLTTLTSPIVGGWENLTRGDQ